MKTFYSIYAICGVAAIGGGLFGFDVSSMSGVLGTQAYQNYFHKPHGLAQGGITAAMPIGSLVGSLASSFIADPFSRRSAIQFGAVLWILGAILQAANNGRIMLCIGRVIAGIAVGICSSIVPVYQAEMAPKEIRGRVLCLQQWAITWGILIQYFIQYGASFIDGGANNPTQGTAAFRIPWGVQAVPGVILFVGMFFLPRSPRWLASQGRWEEALEVLAHLRGGGDKNHPKVVGEYNEIKETQRHELEDTDNSLAALFKPRLFSRVLLGMSIQMWCQLSGINVMLYYVVFLMKGAGVDNSLFSASIQYIILVTMTLPTIVYLDRFGRRPTLLIGAFSMMTCMFTAGALLAIYGHKNPDLTDHNVSWVIPRERKSVSKAIIACSYLFVAFYAATWGPTGWAYASEIFPAKARAKAVSLTTAATWFSSCVLALAIPPILWSIHWKMYMIFGAFDALALIHVFFAAPETKGRTLEEMDDVFHSGLPAWKTSKANSDVYQTTHEPKTDSKLPDPGSNSEQITMVNIVSDKN